ncbi:MAG: IS1634 family transposase, partial [Micromonosporaceae bacterium]
MASLCKKVISGKPCWYLREMGWADGKPKLVSERYLGTAADIGALLDAREAAVLPERTRHLAFGDVAAAWGVVQELGVAGIIDEVAGPGRADAGASTGTYLALAAVNRVAAPCSKRGFAEWWKTTAADRFTALPASALDHRRFWEAMHAVTVEQMEEISRRIAVRLVEVSGVDVPSVALDMANFAAFMDTADGKAPAAQRGKARQKRSDLRLVGLGLVVTRDGGIPLTWHAYPGGRPDVTQFTGMIDQLKTGCHQAVCAAAGLSAEASDMTVVFGAGQNSEANFTHLAGTGLHYIGSVPASDCPDLTALPASVRAVVDPGRFGGLTGYDTRRVVYGAERRAILTHSPGLRDSQARELDGTTLAKAGKKLDELAATLARGKTRRSKDKVAAEITAITAKPWVRRVITWQLDGDQPKDLRLTWGTGHAARTALEDELSGKHELITSHDDWPAAEIIAGHRSQPEAEFSFRQLKDPHVVSFSPIFHRTEHNIRVHVFTCVLALQ